MKILRIYKENSKRVAIEFEDGNSLSIFKDIVYQFSLRKFDLIDEKLFGEIKEKQIFLEIRERALLLLAKRAHSKYELKQKLIQKKFDKEKIPSVLDNLQKEGYLNDLEFAKVFANERILRGKSGPIKIKAELMAKGISRENVEEVINLFFPSEENDESALLVAQKKYNQLQKRNLESHVLKQKLYSFLLARGFSYEVAKITSEKILNQI